MMDLSSFSIDDWLDFFGRDKLDNVIIKFYIYNSTGWLKELIKVAEFKGSSGIKELKRLDSEITFVWVNWIEVENNDLILNIKIDEVHAKAIL